ncbi:guanylate cyclase soluble subunit beta-1-like [Leptonychotes weddellii]|uniref:Guanylate cyclase soluble subunit beta-1-like n=1 Tax=Leptonychotes weddellii TaxID=9713 RepID=A0A7F8Q455_LEPWE|nr:guanylate cyclase soluble subunit beta-1-like [Leptonychotes weddellii]
MYRFINTCLQSFVIEKFGEETWEKLKASAEVQDAFMTYTVYDDIITIKLIQEACKVLGKHSQPRIREEAPNPARMEDAAPKPEIHVQATISL